MRAMNWMKKGVLGLGANLALLSAVGCGGMGGGLIPDELGGGTGGTGGGTGGTGQNQQQTPPPVTPPPPPPATPILYTQNFNANGVLAWENPATLNGNIAPDLNLSGGQTQLAAPTAIVIDNSGALVVASRDGNRITFYDDAETASGNLKPDRNLSGAATGLSQPMALAHDAGSDLLFEINFVAPFTINVFEEVSTAAANGNVAPVRSFSNAGIAFPREIVHTADDDLYVLNSFPGRVNVFADASTLNGPVMPTRIINSPFFAGVTVSDIFIDGNDTMYAVEITNGRILVFKDASTLNGSVMPDTVLTVTGAGTLFGVVVDSNGVGYITDSAKSAIYSYDDLADRNGNLPPDRTIQGGKTQMNGPWHLYLKE